MTIVSISPDKLIDGLFALPTEQELREGDFCVTLADGEQPGLRLSLSIRAPVRVIPPLPEPPPPKEEATVRTYQTTSYFLRECHQQLYAGNPTFERQLLISGPSFLVNARHILDISVPVKLANVSHTGVEAKISDLLRHLADLDISHGLLLLGVFHSHLWKGRSAVNPSDTDRTLQTKLEEEGYRALQAIFSMDGYIGFFTNYVPFALEVLGTGVEEVETHAHQRVVRLIEAPPLSHDGLSRPASPRAQRLSSPNANPRL